MSFATRWFLQAVPLLWLALLSACGGAGAPGVDSASGDGAFQEPAWWHHVHGDSRCTDRLPFVHQGAGALERAWSWQEGTAAFLGAVLAVVEGRTGEIAKQIPVGESQVCDSAPSTTGRVCAVHTTGIDRSKRVIYPDLFPNPEGGVVAFRPLPPEEERGPPRAARQGAARVRCTAAGAGASGARRVPRAAGGERSARHPEPPAGVPGSKGIHPARAGGETGSLLQRGGLE